MFNVLENYIRKVKSLVFLTFEKLSIETEFSHKYLKGHFFLIGVSRGIFTGEILKLYKHFENTPDRSSHLRCSVKKGVLRNLQNSQENTCARVSFLIKLRPSVKRVCFDKIFSESHIKAGKSILTARILKINNL